MTEKALKIGLGSCKRLQKDVGFYEKEVEKQSARIQGMKAEGKDEYDIRKQEEVLEDSRKMIPDCKKRLEVAVESLRKLVDEAREKDENNVTLTEAFAQAESFLKG